MKFKLTLVIQILYYAYGICSDQLLIRTLFTRLKIYLFIEDDIEDIYEVRGAYCSLRPRVAILLYI